MPSKTWYVVEVMDSPLDRKPLGGEKITVVVTPHLEVELESRSLDDIMRSASDKGMNTSYCSLYSGMSSQRSEEIRRAVHSYVVGQVGNIGQYDVCIEPVARITLYN